MKAKCPKCGYEWNTQSKHVYVSCPSCLSKVKLKVLNLLAELDKKNPTGKTEKGGG